MPTILKIGRKTPRAILLCPGPVLLSKAVQRAVVSTNIGHRESEFSSILSESAEMLKPIAGIDSSYEVAFITGSGTAANETIISSIGKLGPVLVISNGEFGERLLAVAKLHNKDIDELKFDWQEKIDLKTVAKALKSKRYHMVAVVHHETSSGMLNPVAEITKLAHKYGAIVSVDAISSIGAEKIRAKEWGVDIIVGASGKALSAMPGAGILIIKSDLVNTLSEPSSTGHYLDLYKHFLYMRNHIQTPNTPAVHVFVSLHASLKEITEQGIGSFQKTIRQRASYTRTEINRMGLSYASYGGNSSSVITCVAMPEHLSFGYLAERLKEKGIIVYSGKGVLKDKIFQIGHIGALRKNDTSYALRQLEKILQESVLEKMHIPRKLDQHEEIVHAV
ncbi:MAG: alanine--glyoxylate aminotransferase family protein [Candidatus Saccharimonadales bacterium]